MMSFDCSEYPPQIAQLLDRRSDGSVPVADVLLVLEVFDFATAVAPNPVADTEMALACESGLWLRHHFLDRSHDISQQIHSSTGSFWHGIMHRLEGDFENAKYWFRKVGVHPIFPSLASAAHTINPDCFVDANDWDPYDFIDRCAATAGQDTTDLTLQEVASAEWELLFAHCFQQALGID